jgi:mannose-6-phosphate isomerase
MIPNFPLRFAPIFRSYIWGGRRLHSMLGKPIPSEGVWAESWEIVDHGPDQSVVVGGPWQGWSLGKLIETHPTAMLGEQARPLDGFPLLLKYLDCNRVLSVQVHPNDEYARKMPKPDLGKTEAWYVIEAQPGALIYAGLKPGVDRQMLSRSIEAGRCEDCLQTLSPKAGDCIFIPAGTVHALGEGLVVAEIQQASDTTFRLFDWNRVGDDGKPRPLHIEQALDVIDYTSTNLGFAERRVHSLGFGSLLVDCDKFQLIEVDASCHIAPCGGFMILSVILGNLQLETQVSSESLKTGDSILLPAACEGIKVELSPGARALVAAPPRKAH